MPTNFVNYNQEFVYDKDVVLSNFIAVKKIDIIYITPTLLALKKVKNDTFFSHILNQPEKYGYFKQKTGNFVPYLLIKKNN